MAHNTLGLIFWIAVSLAAGIFGSRFMPGEWYASLNKPSFNPPGWIFGPVWTILYIMMGVAAHRVWMLRGFRQAAPALALFITQLLFNALWSWLFFGLQRPDLAFIDIIVLWITILLTLLAFRQHSDLAATLLIPYLAWVSFAAILNASIWRLNP